MVGQREQVLGLDELLPVVARPPFDALVAGLEHQPIVFPADDAVDHLEKMAAIDAGVAVSWQRVAIDTHLLVEHLHGNRSRSNDKILEF